MKIIVHFLKEGKVIKVKNKKLQIILGSISLILIAAIAVTGVQVASKANEKIKKKTVIEHKELQYVDDEFNNYIDDVIDNVNNVLDNISSSDTNTTNNPSYSNSNNVSSSADDSGEENENKDNQSEDNEVEDNLDWIGGGSKEEYKEYPAAVQMKGTTPVDSAVRNVKVTTSDIAYKDFYGYGACLFPEILSNDVVSGGYNSVAWEFERQKIITNSLNVSRIPIDMDAIITNTEPDPMREDYQNNSDYIHYMQGEYDFINDSANSFWETVDCLDTINAAILLNSGWKCANRIKMWYPEVSNDYANSAPYDINAFVRANIAWLLECQRRGYNIKFIDFGNEVQWGGDFKTYHPILDYYTVLVCAMTEAMEYARNNEISYKALNADGTFTTYTSKLTMDTEMLAVDVAGVDDSVEWMSKLEKNLKQILGDRAPWAYSNHIYYKPINSHNEIDYNDLYNFFGKSRETLDTRCLITEFYASPAAIDEDYHQTAQRENGVWNCGDWDRSYASYIIAAANTGALGANNWHIATSFFPCVNSIGSTAWCDGAGLQFVAGDSKEDCRVTTNYRLTSLFGNYVDIHSDVLKSEWEGDDIRVASFKLPDGGYTFVVESKKSDSARTLKLAFDKNVGTLYRYKFVDSTSDPKNRNLGGTIASCDKTFNNVTELTDTLDNDYCVYFYSTKPPVAQVELDKAVETIGKTETLAINAKLLDCEAGCTVKYTISAASKNNGTSLVDKDLMEDSSRRGDITDDGNGKCVYTPGANAQSGDSVAIRATLYDSNGNKTDTYAVAIIYIE